VAQAAASASRTIGACIEMHSQPGHGNIEVGMWACRGTAGTFMRCSELNALHTAVRRCPAVARPASDRIATA